MLQRWAVLSGAYLLKYLSDCLQISHTTPLGGLVVPFGVYKQTLTYFWFRTMTYLDVLTHTSFPEQISKSIGPITVILHIHFWTLTLKLTQHFGLIYTIGNSD